MYKIIKKFIHQFASPKSYLLKVDRYYTAIFYLSIFIFSLSVFWGLFLTPEDYIQGNSFRIIYLHVPASFVSQSLYAVMAISGVF